MKVLVSTYLNLNNYSKLDISEFKETFFSHPDYPSLYGVTESLELIGVDAVATMVSKDQVHELPDKFIALIEENGFEEMVLIHQIKDEIKTQNTKGKRKNLSLEEFTKNWNGIILLIEENNQPKTNQIRARIGLMPTIISIIALILGTSLLSQPFSVFPFLMQLLSAFGVLVSILIIQEDIGRSNPIIEKVCKSKSDENSCSSVIKSKTRNFLLDLKFSDLPILFFSSCFLLLTVDYLSFNTVGFISTLGLPVLFYSVFLQKYVIKQWCVLCLITAGIIAVQSIIYLLNFRTPAWNTVFIFLSVLISVGLFWNLLKGVLKENVANFEELYKLKRFKRDYGIFNMLFEQSEYYNTKGIEGIEVGDQEAFVQLELFLSPSCTFCYKTYQEAYKLLKTFPEKLKLKIYFNLLEEDEEADEDLQIAKKIIEYYIEFNSIEALNNWFLKEITPAVWQNKWGKAEKHIDRIKSIIKKQQEFCAKNNWNYAPTLLVERHLLAAQYTAEDLKYFINEIIYNKELRHT